MERPQRAAPGERPLLSSKEEAVPHLSGSLLCCPFEVSLCACELACSERLRRRGAPCYAEGALVPDEQQSMVFSMLIL